MRSFKFLVFVPALLLAVGCSTPAPVHVQSAAADDVAILLLPEQELAGAAAECGIGIAGERTTRVAAAAAADPVIGLGKWVGGLVAGHIKGVLTRRLGLDEEYNRYLALSRQMRMIEGQLQALSEKFDRLGDQIRIAQFRTTSLDLAKRFVDPVKNGTRNLEILACEEAAVLNAERMGRDPQRAKETRDDALAEFEKRCAQADFEDIPSNLTGHFKNDASILDRYLEAVILPRRYLTSQDSRELDDFFYRYHLVQIEALRLMAECALRFPGGSVKPEDARFRDSVADRVYRRPNSFYHRASMDELPKILPEWLPDNIILDTETGLLWWNGLDFGAHPFVNKQRLIQDRTINLAREVAGPKGTWKFELAKLTDVEKLAALNAAMPAARRGDSSRYPATLKPFLQEIGLDKVAERIAATGNLSFVWTSDVGKPIRRCHTRGGRACIKWYDPHDTLGQTAGTAAANSPTLRATSGNIWYAPEQCQPDKCLHFWNENPRVVSLCKDPQHLDGLNRCVSDAVLGMWQAPGIYRAAQLANDRFFKFDFSPVR